MPRRRSRFSNLEYALKLNGGQPGTNSVLTKYVDFKSGKTKVDRRKAALTTAQRVRSQMSLAPFNKDYPGAPTIADRYVGSITAYSWVGIKGLLTNADTELGYGKTSGNSLVAKSEAAYYPALIKPFQATAEGKNTASKITGKDYKYVEGKSFSAPFGRTTAGGAADSEEERRELLAIGLRSVLANNVKSVGYDPEVFRGLKESLAELV